MTVTAEQFTAAMRAAVAERGRDFVYPRGVPGWRSGPHLGNTCMYVRTDVDECGCLIGDAAHRVGVSLDQLREADVREFSAEEMLRVCIPGLPPRIWDAAGLAQTVQDSGRSWGLALDRYLCALDEEEATRRRPRGPVTRVTATDS